MNLGEVYYCSRCMREMEEEGICPACGYNPNQPAIPGALEEGTLLNGGRYQLGAVIGEGGFGITYAAWDHVLQIPVAVKEYVPKGYGERDTTRDDTLRACQGAEQIYQKGLQRFRREARILATLGEIKGVVAVRDCFEGNGTAYLVMEFVRGVTLDCYVSQRQTPPGELLERMRGVMDALSQIHHLGVLHRDISPGNLLVQEDGTVTLIDFGAAARLTLQARGEDRTVILHKGYAAMEQYDPEGRQGPWTDVYGLCATLYHLLTQESLPEAVVRQQHDTLRPLGTYRLGLRPAQEQAIMDGLAVRPEQRTQSIQELSDGLYGGRRRKRLPYWLRRYGMVWGLLALLVGVGLFAWAGRGSWAPSGQETGDALPSPAFGEPVEVEEPAPEPAEPLGPFRVVSSQPGNLTNGGVAVEWEDILCYQYPDGGIYQETPEGETRLLTETGAETARDGSSSCLNGADGWLYFLDAEGSIRRISLEDGQEEMIREVACQRLYLTPDALLYLSPNTTDALTTDYSLYRLGQDGVPETVLSDCAMPGALVVTEEAVYYVSSGDYGVYCLALDGSTRTKLTDRSCTGLVADGGWLYGSESYGGLWRIRTDGTQEEAIGEEIEGTIFSLNVSDGWLYYDQFYTVQEPRELWRIRLDGTGAQRLWRADERGVVLSHVSVVGSQVFFNAGSALERISLPDEPEETQALS